MSSNNVPVACVLLARGSSRRKKMLSLNLVFGLQLLNYRLNSRKIGIGDGFSA